MAWRHETTYEAEDEEVFRGKFIGIKIWLNKKATCQIA